MSWCQKSHTKNEKPAFWRETCVWESEAFPNAQSPLKYFTTSTNLKRHTHSTFIAALFTIAKTWEQPKCSSLKKKTWHIRIHNGIASSHNKEWSRAICENMGGSLRLLSKWSKSDSKTETPYSHSCVASDKQSKRANKTTQNSQKQRTDWWLSERRRLGRWRNG